MPILEICFLLETDLCMKMHWTVTYAFCRCWLVLYFHVLVMHLWFGRLKDILSMLLQCLLSHRWSI